MELPIKLGVGGATLFFLGIIIGFMAFSPSLKTQDDATVKLKHGAEIREAWVKTPFPYELKVYLFNVTNAAGITNGDKPILHEVGPFVYDEWNEKVQLEDHEEDDTVEYSQRITWIFNPSKSNGLTGNEIIVIPDLLLLSIVMTTLRIHPHLIGLAAKAVDSIFKKPDSVFVEATAHDILFGGLPVDCNVKDFAGSAVCSVLEKSPSFETIGKHLYLFSLFGYRNGTVDKNRLRVKRGRKSMNDVGKVISFNGEPRLSDWSEGSQCNEFNGTDSTIFHPFLFQDEDVVSFAPDLCRSFSARWDGTHTSVGGITANHYTVDFGDMSNDPNLKCFCSTEDTCLKKGLYDVYNCAGAPIVASLPHFYKVDESYLEQVVGLEPKKEKHQMDMDFEPITGTPMSVRKRVQINMFIHAVEKVKIMNNFPIALLPILWLEESVTLGDEILDQLRTVVKTLEMIGLEYQFKAGPIIVWRRRIIIQDWRQ